MRLFWQRWRENPSTKFTLPPELPTLRMLLVCDNLARHKTPEFVVCYALTASYRFKLCWEEVGCSLLPEEYMEESIQQILKQRALSRHHPQTPQQMIDWLEAVAQA